MTGTLLGLLALACNIGAGVLWFRRVRAVAIPENRSSFVGAMLTGVVLGILGLVLGAGWLGGSAAALAIAAGGMFCFTVLIGDQQGGPGALRIGAPVPDFSAPDEHGELFQLSSLSGRPFLLKFFRGHW